jgi:hypothetical protein
VFLRSPLVHLGAPLLLLLGCGPASSSSQPGSPATPPDEQPTRRAEETEAEPCRVFTLVREPTVASRHVANVVVHGDQPGSLVTVIREDSKELIATTVDQLEAAICERLEPAPYLLYLFKEKGKLVGQVSTPTAPPDIGRDARAVCAAEKVGAEIAPKGSPGERRSMGLQQAAGSLTTPKYRALLFDVLHVRDEASAMALVRELDEDIRAEGDAAWDACTILVKK